MLYFTQERNAQIGFHLDYKFNFDTPFGDKFVSARQKQALGWLRHEILGNLWHGVGHKMISETPVR